MTEKEKNLITGCVKGDKGAWDEFVQQYSNLVYHTIRKTLPLHQIESRDETVEDLYQEFFISILQNNCRKLSQFRGDGGCTLANRLSTLGKRPQKRRAKPFQASTIFSTLPPTQSSKRTIPFHLRSCWRRKEKRTDGSRLERFSGWISSEPSGVERL